MFRGILLITLALAFAAPAQAKGRIVVSKDHVAVEASPASGVDKRQARKLLADAHSAFTRTGKLLGLQTYHVFHSREPLPPWLPPVARKLPGIVMEVVKSPRPSDVGYAAFLSRMKRGEYRIYLAAPGAEIGPGTTHDAGAEMARAVTALLVYDAAPLWFREGLAHAVAWNGVKGEDPRISEFTSALVKAVQAGQGLDVTALVRARKHEEWEAAGGAAASWALVRLLTESKKGYVVSFFHRIRSLVRRITFVPSDEKLRAEFDEMTFRTLSPAGGPLTLLDRALRIWVKRGFPTGSELRKSEIPELLESIAMPEPFRVDVRARWGRRYYDRERDISFLPLQGNAVEWRLPWPGEFTLWVSVRRKPGSSRETWKERLEAAYSKRMDRWSGFPSGSRRIAKYDFPLRVRSVKAASAVCYVTSPNGLQFVFGKCTALR